jgi:hypothetical protein
MLQEPWLQAPFFKPNCAVNFAQLLFKQMYYNLPLKNDAFIFHNSEKQMDLFSPQVI